MYIVEVFVTSHLGTPVFLNISVNIFWPCNVPYISQIFREMSETNVKHEKETVQLEVPFSGLGMGGTPGNY